MRLLVTGFVVVAACSSPSPRKPAVEATGRAQRIPLGTLEAYAIADGHLTAPNDGKGFGVGRPVSETGDLLAAAGLARDPIEFDLQCLLVKDGDRVLLFDTGMGEATLPDTGQLRRSLALAAVQPGAITDVFISHAHGDHVGGLVTKAGALAFPAATIHMSAPEWAAFQADPDKDGRRIVAVIAPKVVAFDPGAQLLPTVKAVATPGHTPGHSSYEIGTDADKVFYLGDLAHHSVISVQRPAWTVEFDGDHAAAEAMRQQTLARLGADGEPVFAVHFPFPGIGHVIVDGTDLVWKPEAR